MNAHDRHPNQMGRPRACDRETLRTRSGRPAVLIGKARRAVEKGNVGTAREVLLHLPCTACNGPKQAALLLRLDLLMDCSRMGGEASAAVLAAAMPDTFVALYALGVCLAGRGRYMQALEHLLLAVELEPDYGFGAAMAAILRVLSLAGDRNPAAGRYWERLGRALHRPGPDGGTCGAGSRAGRARGHPALRVETPRRRYL